MQEDTIKDVFNADRLERLADKGDGALATSKAGVLKIGCQPAIYKKGDGHFTAIAHGNQTTYVMDIKRERDRVVGRFLVNNKETLTMEGASFRRVIRCLATASNAYVALNQHTKERKRRAAKKEGK